MPRIIESYEFVQFEELNYCHKNGIMYQRDMSRSVEYAKDYFEKYIRYENTEIANKLNASRTKVSEKYCKVLLDIGIGSGEFIKESNVRVFGYDINHWGIKWLKDQGLFIDVYADSLKQIEGFTFWDSLEHIPDHDSLLNLFVSGQHAFISLPTFSNLLKVKFSKHYKPDEHYYYFTGEGLIGYMNDFGFDTVEINQAETDAGREDIITYVFRKR